jgi:hypothetical protein
MRRSMIFLSLVACGIFLATAGAYMQSGSRKQLGRSQDSQPKIAQPDALPQTYLNPNRLHKLIVSDKERDIHDRLARANAIRNEIDYGSYKLIVVDEEAVGGRAALQAMPVAIHDEQNMIVFNGYLIDTSNPQPLSKEPPADLKLSRMREAVAGAAAPGKGLYIIQFIGPIQDSWFRELEKTGVEIIAYAPHNAYVVFASERAAGELMKMKGAFPFVQWMGDYQPAYKLSPGLQAARQGDASRLVKVTVQLIDNGEGARTARQLRASARQYLGEQRVLKYRNLRLEVSVSQLAELGQSDEVFAIEDERPRVRMDEAQGQIVASNLSGNAPSGPGYLSWLAGKSFNSAQFGSFAVNVVDDARSLRGHPDLPDSRIAFENNPSNIIVPQLGHGFLNAHIIGGFNDGTGSAYEDANGLNYGLGIAPWARVGVTNIFCGSFLCSGINDQFNPTLWEGTAYGQGSRISSNSWGADFGSYDTLAQEYDGIVRDAQREIAGNQQLAVVFSAGNAGQGGEGSIGSPGTSKNVITVGASENVRMTGADGCGIDNSGADSANDIAFFSGHGPVNPGAGDGRVKPDIVAPGTHIQAGVPQSDYLGFSVCDQYFPPGQTLYSWSSGTSHSTPAVAGGAALVYQDFLNKGMEAPSPAMIKAVLMNSASYLTGAGAGDALPSNVQGMGLMNLGRTFDDTPRLLTDQTRTLGSSGETYNVTGAVATSSQPFRVTLAWTDAPGSTTSAPWVNNLDLEVTINGQVYKGNVFSGPNSTAGGAADGKNNVESVFLPAGVSGRFLVKVRAINIAGDGLPGNADPTDQDFALVIYNANAEDPDSPIIEVSPTFLNFKTAAGANPANQSINIGNIGIDPLHWEASADAPWLIVSPASATAPSQLTAIVNASSLPIGAYQATITISSTNAFNSPVTVPVTLAVLPVFEVNPPSLDLIVPFGSGNPPNQTISISPNDDRFRDWTASDDAPWLTINPASGAAPAQLSASIDVTGLSLGVYNGRITIRSTNPSIPAITVPVTLTVDSVFEGGFESAVSPWVFSGVAMRSTGGRAHSGLGYLLLGGANSSSGSVYQQIDLPRGTSPKLTFWLNVTSTETAMAPNDRLSIEVCNRSGKVLKTLATFSNLNRSEEGNYVLAGSYSLARFAGQSVRIQFRTTTNSSSITSFRVDDVSVK